MLCNYRYRLYPSKSQARLLARVLETHCQLYNAALQERRDAWRICAQSISYYDQANQLKVLREFDDDAQWLNYTSIQQTLRRLDKAFAAFFRRVKSGKKAGYPRFRSRRRWHSAAYIYGDGLSVRDGRLRVQNVGHVKMVVHRPIPDDARIKRVVIKCESPQHWFATFSLEMLDPKPLPKSGAVTQSSSVTPSHPVRDEVGSVLRCVGIDVGLNALVATSDGELIDAPKSYRREEKELARAQRHGRKKVAAKIHRRIRNRRVDFAHKLSRDLVARYDLIAIE